MENQHKNKKNTGTSGSFVAFMGPELRFMLNKVETLFGRDTIGTYTVLPRCTGKGINTNSKGEGSISGQLIAGFLQYQGFLWHKGKVSSYSS